MATTDTVLQPGAEDLSAFTGPTGPPGATGTIGATGPGVNTNLLTLLVSMNFTVGNVISYAEAQTTVTYLVYDGTKFAATGSHVINTVMVNTASRIVGSMTGFLATATDPYTGETVRQKYITANGLPVYSGQSLLWDVNVYQKTNNEFFWGISGIGTVSQLLGNVGGTLDTFEFSINITA